MDSNNLVGIHREAITQGYSQVSKFDLSRRKWWLTTGKAVGFGLLSSIVPLQMKPASASDTTPAPPAIGSTPFQVAMDVALDEMTTARIVIEVHPEWAPSAATRFQELIQDNFFTESKFFRVLPGYVAQFGIAGNPELNKKWMFDRSKGLLDEPRLQSNRRGTLSFASSGKDSRQTQIFINLGNNGGPPNFLDAQGFVPFAQVISGMDDVVPKIYNGYGIMETASAGITGSVNQGKAAYYGNEYLNAIFPKLSTIQKITVLQ